MKFHKPSQIKKRFTAPHTPTDWTVVVPAAGRGSRLGYDQPKILYPIAGRPILEWLIDLLEPNVAELVFVLSPAGAPVVEPHLKKRLGKRYRVAIQPEPKGMADAIYQAVPDLATPHTLVIWGDQVAIRPTTIEALLRLHQHTPTSTLTLPIVERSEPYVHYHADKQGWFTKVLERREGAAMPAVGQSDTGLFALDTALLQEIFARELAKGITLSQGTKEWNFLPLLPQFERGGTSVNALLLDTPEETVGVNDARDVAILEAYFKTLRP